MRARSLPLVSCLVRALLLAYVVMAGVGPLQHTCGPADSVCPAVARCPDEAVCGSPAPPVVDKPIRTGPGHGCLACTFGRCDKPTVAAASRLEVTIAVFGVTTPTLPFAVRRLPGGLLGLRAPPPAVPSTIA